MASKDPLLISDPEEHKWVVEISEILNHQLKINFETPSVSLFQVPKTITTKKPEAYEPQQIGLGPLHHFRIQPYKKMEQKKLVVVRRVLQDYKIKDFKVDVVDKVEQLVPVVRSCYDMFLPDEDTSLAWVSAIDGLFLLNVFYTYNSLMDKEMEEYLRLLKEKAYEVKQKLIERPPVETVKLKLPSLVEHQTVVEVNSDNEFEEIIQSGHDLLPPLFRPKELVVTQENHFEWEQELGIPYHRPELPKVGVKKRLMAQDILMVENQIPFMVLKEIDTTLHPKMSGNSSVSTHEFSPNSVFRTFCEIHSPLELCSNDQAPSSVEHLLHYMYYSIVNNVIITIELDAPRPTLKQSYASMAQSAVGNVYEFVINIPQNEIVQAYEQTISILETFSQSKFLVPSASKLHVESGFKFQILEKNKGIQNISVREKVIYLPNVTLNNNSEVILRNLVAYETITASSDSFPLSEYMGFMSALITTVEDVKILKRCDIIKGDLGEDEIAQLFNGISSSIPSVKTKEKSKLQETIDEINKVYNSRLRMKTYLMLKKLARSLLVILKAVGGFVEGSWKIVAFMVSIVTVFLLTSQAYCDAYGCGEQTVTLAYTSS